MTVYFKGGNEQKARVLVDGKKIKINGNLNLAQPVVDVATKNGNITTQIVSKKAGEITVLYKGTPFKVTYFFL